MKRQVMGAFVVGMVFLFGLTSLGFTQEKPTGRPIKIGIVTPQQGGLADSWGIPTRQGVELGIEVANNQGGVKGRPLVPVARDDRGQVQGTVTAFQELVRDPDIVTIIGPSQSGNAMAVRPIINENRIPQFACVYGPQLGKTDFKYFYRCHPALDVGNRAALRAARKAWGDNQRLAIFSATDAGGVEGAEHAASVAPEFGMKVVAQEKYTLGDTDATAQLTRIRAANPTSLLSLTQGVMTNAIVRNIRQLGMTGVHIIGPNGLADAQSVELAGNLLNGVVFWDYACLDDEGNPAMNELRALYKARFNRELSQGVVGGYDAVLILRAGLDKVVQGNEPISRDALNTALSNLTVKAVGSLYEMTPDWHNGAREEQVPVCTYRDGKRLTFRAGR